MIRTCVPHCVPPMERSAETGRPVDDGLGVYRDRTVALLRKYMRLAVETGRLPSLLGREFFRAHVTSYHARNFEDVVIFVHDVESVLERMERFDRELLASVVLQDYSISEMARLLRSTRPTVTERYFAALDACTRLLLRCGLLQPLPCQEGDSADFGANH